MRTTLRIAEVVAFAALRLLTAVASVIMLIMLLPMFAIGACGIWAANKLDNDSQMIDVELDD